MLIIIIVQTVQEGSDPSNVFREFARPIRDVVVSSIAHPPRVALVLPRHRAVQFLSVADVHFLVQSSVNHHDGASHFLDAIDIGINI